MEAVTVRLLSGQQFAVPCQPGATVADIKQSLAALEGGPKRCRVTLRGAVLGDGVLLESLGLRQGEFLVAFETRKKKAAQPSASAAAAVDSEHDPLAAATSPGSPRRHLPPQPLASPNKLDSLLPGYLSRPNASPVKPSMLRAPLVPPVALGTGSGAPVDGKPVLRLPPPPAALLHQRPAQHEERGGGPVAKRAKRTLLDLAALQYGGSGGDSGQAARASAAGQAALFTQPQAAPAGAAARTAGLAAAQPGAGHAAQERGRMHPPAQPPSQQQQQQQQSPAHQELFDDLRAELFEAEQAPPQQQPIPEEQLARQQAARQGGGGEHAGPAGAADASNVSGAGTAAGAAAAVAAVSAADGKPQRRPSRGAGSKRKQQPAQPSGGAESASPGPVSMLALSEADLDAAAAALPLPALAESLEASFLALSQLHEFLLRTHIQATWKNVREAAQGMRLRRPLTLPDCELIAALSPELVAVQQHHRVAPRSYRDSWRAGQVSSPTKARAVVAAAVAAEAAAGGADQPLPNPMHLRSDGAGTVLEPAAVSAEAGAGQGAAAAAQDDTKVIDVVDPGRGFLSRPIPAPFLAQLRRRAAAAGSAGAAANGPDSQAEEAGAEAASDEEMQGHEEAGGGGAAAAASNAGSGGRRPAIRVNRLTRQRWCFRRALVRALLLLQQQRVGTAAVVLPQADGAPAQRGRRRAGGAGSAAAVGAADSQPAGEQQASWHPGFDPTAVTPAELAAAGEALSAPSRAAAAAAEQESGAADALQAARRLAGGAGAGSSGPEHGRGGQPPAGAAGDTGSAAAGQRAAARPPQLTKQHAPCTDITQMDSQQFLAHLQSLPWYQGQVVHIEQLAARQAAHAAPATPLAPPVAAALQLRGVRRLFTHQAAAMDHLLQGRHTVVATSTASGKSLCYTVPILQALAQDRSACALLMFPTKALAQDQLRALRELAVAAFGSGGDPPPTVHVYDGDTPMGEREAIRSEAQLLITNPDMLHMSVLPVHQQFGRLLANLKYVVVDEGHAYKGVFGCHTALVLRRLRRLCERVYHSQPTFAVTTATVANPAEHARELLGVEHVHVVEEDGSPHGPKTFVMWNPPLRQGGPPGALSRTEERARGGERRGRRAAVAQRQRARQQANQERGDGVLYGAAAASVSDSADGCSSPSDRPSGAPTAAEQLAAAKLSRRRRQLEAAVEQEPSMHHHQQQQQQQQKHGKDSGALQEPTGLAEAGGAAAEPQQAQLAQHGQQGSLQAGQQARGELPPALQREVAAAAAAIAAVGGSARRQTLIMQQGQRQPWSGRAGWGAGAGASVPARPLIRRKAAGGRSSLQQMAGGSGSGSKLRSSSAGSRQQRAARPSGAAHQRAGGGVDGGQQEEEHRDGEEQEEDEAYRARLPTSMRPWLEAQTQHDEAGQLAGGSPRPRAGRRPTGEAGEEGESEDERRSSPIVEISLLLAECVQHGLRTIAFCKSRKLCELVTAYVREILKCTAPQLAGSIAVYRAGYSPSERREIERALFQGNLRAVAATNALELGVDVGSLDCTLHLGFPGSVASFWQQAGRAGRREQHSLGIYLGWDGPLDQYLMRHPGQLFGRPIEKALVDAHNPSVLDAHAACAAAEAPLLLEDDQRYFGPTLPAVAARLQAAALLGRHPLNPTARALHYIGAVASPASKVSLRAIDPERYAIVDESQGGALLEEIEESKAFFEVYDGAVYMYQGRTYLCKKLDLDARVAVVRPADLKYYTKCIDYTDVHVRGGKAAYKPAAAPASAAGPPAGATATAGPGAEWQAAPAEQQQQQQEQQEQALTALCSPALVTTRWLGFRRIWRGTGEVFDTVDLFVPDVQFETQAASLRLPRHVRQRLKEAGLPFRDGVHAACHAVLNVLPLFLLCNPSDMGAECDSPWDTRFRPERLLLYDKHPGGIGLAAAVAPLFPLLLRRALRLVRECGCVGRAGCPACVQHADCSEYNAVLHKPAAAALLEALLGEHGEGGGGEGIEPDGEGGDSEEEAGGAAAACAGCCG